jgi:hypothetical protein
MTVPGANFWIDWTFPGTVDWVRATIPDLARNYGFGFEESRMITTSTGWGSFNISRSDLSPPGPVGVARVQDGADGRAQMIIAPIAGRSDFESSRALNDFAVLLYTELVRDGRLPPPPPLETVSRSLVGR